VFVPNSASNNSDWLLDGQFDGACLMPGSQVGANKPVYITSLHLFAYYKISDTSCAETPYFGSRLLNDGSFRESAPDFFDIAFLGAAADGLYFSSGASQLAESNATTPSFPEDYIDENGRARMWTDSSTCRGNQFINSYSGRYNNLYPGTKSNSLTLSEYLSWLPLTIKILGP
jgi:hypothetical protein